MELNDFLPGMDIRNRTTFSPSEWFNAIGSLTVNVDRALMLRVAQLSDLPDAAAIGLTPKFGRQLAFNVANKQLYYWEQGTTSWTAIPSGQVNVSALITDGIVTSAKLATASAGNRVKYWNGSAWSDQLVSDLYASGGFALDKLATGAEASFLRIVSGSRVWDSLANVTAAIIASITSYDITKLSNRIANAILVTDSSAVASWQSFSSFFSSLAAKVIPIAKIQGSSVNRQVPVDDGTGNLVMTTIPFTRYVVKDDPGGVLATNASIMVRDFTSIYSDLGNNKPTSYQVVLRCTTNDGGFSVGDEIPLEYTYNSSDSFAAMYASWINATNKLTVSKRVITNLSVKDPAGATQNLTVGSWTIRVYAYA